MEASLRQPDIRQPLLTIGMVPRTTTPAAFSAELDDQVKRLAPLARQATQPWNRD